MLQIMRQTWGKKAKSRIGTNMNCNATWLGSKWLNPLVFVTEELQSLGQRKNMDYNQQEEVKSRELSFKEFSFFSWYKCEGKKFQQGENQDSI